VVGIGGIPQKLWEPALLAIAVGQSMEMLAVLAQSLAGLAPTGICGVVGIDGIPRNLWEPALLAMAVGQLMGRLAVLANRWQTRVYPFGGTHSA
jgi:pimeloyl-ACP methyl ester carboxylesterase